MDRISTFQSFIARSPADPFPRYGLAMEYKSQGRLDEARAAFVELLDGFPDYVPAYLQAGNVLVALGDRAGDPDRRYPLGAPVPDLLDRNPAPARSGGPAQRR